MKRRVQRLRLVPIAGTVVLSGFLVFAVLGMRVNVLHSMSGMPDCGNAGQPFMLFCPHYALQHLEDWQHLLQIVPGASLPFALILVTSSVLALRVALGVRSAAQHWRFRQRLRKALAATIRYEHQTLLFATGILHSRLDA